MYYRSNTVLEMEDLVMEFLAYRKAKRAPEYVMQGEQIGKGWPNYKGMEVSQIPQIPQITQVAQTVQAVQAADSMCSKPLHDEHFCSEISKKLEPFVTKVIDEMEHEGGCEYKNKEKVMHIVDKSIDMAMEKLCELENLDEDAEHNEWSRYKLLRALVEILVYAEIHCRKKPALY